MTQRTNPNQPPSAAGNAGRSRSRARRRASLFTRMVLLGVFVLVVAVAYLLSQDDASSPAPAGGYSNNISPITPAATHVPPTEPPTEVALQQQLRDWFLTVAGVSSVSTLDIDVPGSEPPLVYAEIDVSPGYNDSRIPDILIAKLNDALKTTRYSDVVVIINDGTQTIEYALDLASMAWNQTILSSG